MRACVLIPSYNEAKTVGSLVKAVRAEGLNVVVVDDGSVDGTGKIAEAEGACVVRYSKNRGKGASVRGGCGRILEKDYDTVIMMDGDGQHDPRDLPRFLTKISESDAGIVIGNRMVNTKNMPLIRWLTNKCMSFIISMVTHQRIPDSQCGYRIIKRKVLEAINLSSSRYEIESEMLIEAARCGFKIASLPIETIYRDESSQINPIIDTLRFIRFLVRSIGRRRQLVTGV